jgi:hypothetical protein
MNENKLHWLKETIYENAKHNHSYQYSYISPFEKPPNTITDKLDQLDCSYRIVKRNGDNDVTILPQTPFIHPVYIPSDCINVKCMVKRETVQDIILHNIDYKSVMEKKKIQRESNKLVCDGCIELQHTFGININQRWSGITFDRFRVIYILHHGFVKRV